LQAIDDAIDRNDGSLSLLLDFSVTLTQDPLYVDGASTLSLPSVNVTVYDNDYAAVDFSKPSVAIVEGGVSQSYDISVSSCPRSGASPIVV